MPTLELVEGVEALGTYHESRMDETCLSQNMQLCVIHFPGFLNTAYSYIVYKTVCQFHSIGFDLLPIPKVEPVEEQDGHSTSYRLSEDSSFDILFLTIDAGCCMHDKISVHKNGNGDGGRTTRIPDYIECRQ
jgi:hypothetical protein